VTELRASIAAAREAFIDGHAVEHEIVVPEDFPIEKPRVRTPGGEGGRSWHRDSDGAFCLWSDEDASHLPWSLPDAVLERIRDWHHQDALGWPDDPPDLDLERYWPHSGVFVLHGDLLELIGLECKVVRGPNSTYKLVPGRAPRKQRRIRSWGAAVLDVGELEQPLHSLHDVLDALDDEQSDSLRAGLESGVVKVILLRYARQGHVGSLGLHVRSRDPIELQAATTAHSDDATLRLRAGFDAEVLQDKRVAIIGVGAIGSLLVDLLARSGCGSFTLVDPDKLRPGNCIRHLAGLDDVGRPKVDAVADHLLAHGVHRADIECLPERATSVQLIERLFDENDLVIDATGNGPGTALVMTASRVLGRDAISVCVQRGGTLARVDRSPLRDGEVHAPPTPQGGPAAEGREGGCGDPISPTPPWACAAAAALAVGAAVDALSERRQYPPSSVQVLVADDMLPELGTMR